MNPAPNYWSVHEQGANCTRVDAHAYHAWSLPKNLLNWTELTLPFSGVQKCLNWITFRYAVSCITEDFSSGSPCLHYFLPEHHIPTQTIQSFLLKCSSYLNIFRRVASPIICDPNRFWVLSCEFRQLHKGTFQTSNKHTITGGGTTLIALYICTLYIECRTLRYLTQTNNHSIFHTS